MKKAVLAIIAATLMLIAVGCSNSDNVADGNSVSGNVNSGDDGNANYSTDADDSENNGSSDKTESTDGDAASVTEENVPEDETDPIQKPAEASTQGNTEAVELSEISGVWSPKRAESVASGAEVSMTEAFGSVYSTYGGSLNISEAGSFTLNVGAYNYSGDITPEPDGLYVQYDDNSTDVYDYIVYDDGTKEIKSRVNDYFVYFG